jgi:hypothetical protein
MNETARDFVQWLVSLDEPGSEERRSVTLNRIIERGREALVDEPYVTPLTTKTGKVLTEEELQGYVEEAERGYDVVPRSAIVSEPDLCRWDIAQKFVLRRGALGVAAESALYAEGVRREMHPGNFRWACSLDSTHALVAQAHAHELLIDLLRPYDVGIFVFDVRVVCLGVPK